MLLLDFTNLQHVKNGFSTDQINSFAPLADEYYQKSSTWKAQGFTDAPYNTAEIDNIKSKLAKYKGKFKNALVLGIGGSMLGLQTIVDAFSYTSDLNIVCLDNIDPYTIHAKIKKLDLNQTLVLVQTKSGGTPETLSQFFYIQSLYAKAGVDIAGHFILVTDPIAGYLRNLANQNLGLYETFDIPANVGGRFSVLTPVGLVIAELMNLDIVEFLSGARETLKNQKIEAMQLAKIQYELSKKGVSMAVLMPYSSRLRTMSNWYVQLLSESIGKEYNLAGTKVNVGITPIPALGATDQHSQVQLFKDGPVDKLVMFLEVENFEADVKISNVALPTQFHYLDNQTFGDLIKAELQGTKISLTESDKPNLSIKIDKVSEYSMGQIFMFLELSVAYLGELFEIDTFDQPGVERGKIAAQEILTANKIK